MELIERINSLDNDIKVLKGEIKSVLLDLREVMNTNENPFSHLENLKGTKPIDAAKLAELEAAIDELKGKVYTTQEGDEYKSNEERVQNLENALESLLNKGIENKEIINNLSESIELLKEKSELGSQELESLKKSIEGIENLINKYKSGIEKENSTTNESVVPSKSEITTNDLIIENGLKESDMDEERIQKIENNLEQLQELNSILIQELKSLKKSLKNNNELGQENISKTDKLVGGRITDMTTLTRIVQWANRTINRIGLEKLNQIVDAHKLIGSLSENEHAIILKAAEIPDMDLNPTKTHIETRYSILALYELDCILNKTQTEAFTVLQELIGQEKELTIEDKNAIITSSNVSMKF